MRLLCELYYVHIPAIIFETETNVPQLCSDAGKVFIVSKFYEQIL